MRTPLSVVFTLAAMALASAAEMDENAALAVLASDATAQKKAQACQRLAVVGGPKSVPALSALLGDEKLAAHARSGLENIKDPAAGTALLNALPHLKGPLLTGAVTSLGVRKEQTAVPALIKIASNPKHEAAGPALASLAQIGSDDAFLTILKILEKGPHELRIPAAHAALVSAEKAFMQERIELAHRFLHLIRKADLPAHFMDAAKALRLKYPDRI